MAIDHVDLLGNTTELIAENKSDLWRKGKPILIGPNCPQEHIKNYLKTQYDADESLMYFMPKSEDGIYDFDAENNKIVRRAIDILNKDGNVIDPSVIDRALKAKLRGRMEVMTDKIVYDGTHNAMGANKTVGLFVQKYAKDPNTELHMVLATHKMKKTIENIEAIMNQPYFKRFTSLLITECNDDYHVFKKWGKRCVPVKDILNEAEGLPILQKISVAVKRVETGEISIMLASEFLKYGSEKYEIVKLIRDVLEYLENSKDNIKIFVASRFPIYKDVVQYVEGKTYETFDDVDFDFHKDFE